MGIPKFLQRLRDSSHHRNSNANNQDASDNRSDQTPTLLEASSPVARVSQNSLTLPQRTSHPGSRPLQATKSPVPSMRRASSPTARPITPLSQITPLSSKHAPSLWNRAYEGLRDENAQLVDRYEKLLSTELGEHVLLHHRTRLRRAIAWIISETKSIPTLTSVRVSSRQSRTGAFSERTRSRSHILFLAMTLFSRTRSRKLVDSSRL
ncbi:hypothetical protein LX32DRAFT_327124 [Colletotrichum zoysiae]|uniref:NWD NACHT-NTPase N-terminal domain-containing protein n=1 Tax=Colletotrichum zoysiae TaxID=1216348 RepID=A0AAD9H298_9PEZI|nr:hypothetical protein LX32DRAFT_327124 [Colletotrichum zoysiae]